MLIKQKQISKNVYDYLVLNEYDPFVAKLIAARMQITEDVDLLLKGGVKDLSTPFLLKDIEKAVDRLYLALKNNEIIGLETDHDCDGQTSHAILYEALTKIFDYPRERIRSYIGHRMKEGYGLSELLMNRILSDRYPPSLIITADNGSTDEARIKILKQNNIDTIVTDHHGVPSEGPPKSAVAVLNPIQPDCKYPDKSIAGCMVAWLLMAALRRKFIQNNKHISNKYGLTNLLDLVAIGTVADCVSMANSHNNRIVTKLGIELFGKNIRNCWNFFEKNKISSEYIAFSIAPMLNSDGRVADALGSVSFLLEDDSKKLSDIFGVLKEQNNQRKKIQKQLSEEANNQASQLDYNKNSLCIFLQNGHAGVHGISASRLKEKFGKPIVIFSQTQADCNLISGSARSVDEINIKQVLDIIAKAQPNLIIKHGGHKAAAGLTIRKQDFNNFYKIFEESICKLVLKHNLRLGPYLEYDFELELDDFALSTLDKINSLEPFGREFEKPIFYNKFAVEKIKLVGKNKNHMQMILLYKNIKSFKAIWFNASEDSQIFDNINVGNNVKVCYQLEQEQFLGQSSLLLKIKTIQL